MLARNLKRLRLDLGLTVGYCANEMHLTRQTIHNLESGRVSCEATMQHYELYLKSKRRERVYAAEHRKQYAMA